MQLTNGSLERCLVTYSRLSTQGRLSEGLIGVHLGMRSVFFVTGALLVGCAALDRWAKNR